MAPTKKDTNDSIIIYDEINMAKHIGVAVVCEKGDTACEDFETAVNQKLQELESARVDDIKYFYEGGYQRLVAIITYRIALSAENI